MYRHIWAEIDLDALDYNLSQICSFVPADRVMGVVKANAYGHGAGETARLLSARGVRAFAVSNAYEALDLRSQGVTGDILILGNIDPCAVSELARNQVTVCVFDADCAVRYSNAAVAAGVVLNGHIKLDTGMGRLGFDCRENADFDLLRKQIEAVFALPGLAVTGAFTHFAAADRDSDEDGAYTAGQYTRFRAGCEVIRAVGKTVGREEFRFHCANSAATLLDHESRPSDFYRAGIILYGLTPSAGLALPCKLRPVMSLKATVAQVKTVRPGDSLSYGRTYTADRPMKIATVTAGYADGYMRGLSNRGSMLIHGQPAPIVGRVCMDQTMVDVTGIDAVRPGDTAVLFGEGLPVERLAEWLGTINYELVCAVAHRVPRVYLKDGKPVKTLRYRSV